MTILRAILLTTVSFSVVVISNTSHAQDAALEEITVVGIRGSLQRSLDVKRDSSSIVDAVSAEDVGKFPDANIADSLQRITGVAIDRNNGEGQFITVRGLGPEFNNVLVNGRTMATDNAGREFSFDILSSDIISRAEVYKSSQARLQEGGIGATVNIVTARPLDGQDGFSFTASAAGQYNALNEETSPEVGLTGSYKNDNATFGILGSIGYSDRKAQRDFSDIGAWTLADITAINGDVNSVGLDPATPGVLQNLQDVHQSRNFRFGREVQDRERLTANITLQSQITDDLLLTVDGLYSDFMVDSRINIFTPFFAQRIISPVVNGNGTITQFDRPGTTFNTNNPLLGQGIQRNDLVTTADSRDAESSQFGANVQWDLSDAFRVTADLSASSAENLSVIPFLVIGPDSTNLTRFNLDPGNDIPSVSGLGAEVGDVNAQLNHFTRLRQLTTEDDITEFRLEGDWDVDKGALQTLSFGTILSNREKTGGRAESVSSSRGLYSGYNLPANPALLTPCNFGSDFLDEASGSGSIPQNFFCFDAFEVLADRALESNLRNNARQPNLTQAEIDAQADAALAIPGGPFAPQVVQGAASNVEEEVFSLFVNTSWAGDFGGDLPWTADVGVRLTRTDTTSTGFNSVITSIERVTGDNELRFFFAPAAPVSVGNEYTNILPSANLKLELDDTKILRFAFSETVTRPTLTALGTDNSFDGLIDGGQSSGGNPELEPFESTNYDVSFEWYYADASFFGFSVFHKEFENFLESQTLPINREYIDVDNGNVVVPVVFDDTRTRNGEEGIITGIETSLQHAFDNGFGFYGNYTYVNSDVERAENSAAADCDYNGLSENSFNLAGFYENEKLSVRAAYNWRDEFLVSCFASRSRPINREAYGQVDLTASYYLTDNIQLFGNVINLLDEDSRDFSVLEERFLEYEDTGARYTIGVRASF